MATRNTFFMKVIILGDTNVGKTALINRYINDAYSPMYRATIGADFSLRSITMDNRVVTLQIWDTAGQDRFKTLVRAFYRGADSCVLAFDVTDRASFKNVDTWRNEFLIQANPRDPDNFPFVVVGTKVDLDCRQISTKEAQQWCEQYHMPYFETSAKDNINVEAAFLYLAGIAVNNEGGVYEDPAVVNPSTADQVDNRDTCHC